MDDAESALGRAVLVLVSARLPMTQKTIAKPNIAAAIAKLMCLRMTKPPKGRLWTICEEPL
jgi:hypothetical protein